MPCVWLNLTVFLFNKICYFTWQAVLTAQGCLARTVPHFFLLAPQVFQFSSPCAAEFSPPRGWQPCRPACSPNTHSTSLPPSTPHPQHTPGSVLGGIPDYRENGHHRGQLGFSLFKVHSSKIAMFLFSWHTWGGSAS